ncbi:cell division protein ZapA [Roseivivax sp. CAU 1761]
MPEVEVSIGGRTFAVACQAGEEEYLRSAARMLDEEAQVLVDQIGRVPEGRMLLMAGLMLADKTAGLEDRLKAAEAREAALAQQVADLQSRPAPDPQRVEVPVLPKGVTDTLAELAARAEALAGEIEERAAAAADETGTP